MEVWKGFREECLKEFNSLRPNLSSYLNHWASERPDEPAIIEFKTGTEVSWKKFAQMSDAFAARLLALGLKKGDVIATTLPLIKEHIALLYGCFRIGVTVAPLDLRLKVDEVDRYFKKIRPKAYFFLGNTPVTDFRPMVNVLIQRHRDRVQHWIQFGKETDTVVSGAINIQRFVRFLPARYLFSKLTGQIARAEALVSPRDPALIIFTTGSTGEPKAALLSHENIHAQCLSVALAFGATEKDRFLINLPPSHVGCITEQLATTFFVGATAVTLPIFNAEDSLAAIEKHRVTLVGQIPAQFNLEWTLPNYTKYDLSSLRFAIYGGQGVSEEFLRKLATMAPAIGSGLGLTETAGFCSYTPREISKEQLAETLGFESPVCKISVRQPMKSDGSAGDELPPDTVGEICYEGPQVFLGYFDDPTATAQAVSREGILYTGDVGSYGQNGLKLAGRRKHIIKPKGYQVFPGQVENYLATQMATKVSQVACVGAPHEIFSEAIIAFVEPRAGENVSASEVAEISKGLAAYARPSHVEILKEGAMPLNRVAKVDYLELSGRVPEIVANLRSQGAWDKPLNA